MAASFPPMMFSMEELVGVVKLIIQMESAVGNDDDKKQQNNDNHNKKHHKPHKNKHHHHHHKNGKNGKHKKEPPNIQRWIARRSKRDILFLLASISGVKMKIYSLPTSSIYLRDKHSPTKPEIKKKQPITRERVCRVSMDGKYLSMGEDCINLDDSIEISLGIDMCYNNVRIILKELGLYQYYNNYHTDTSSSSSSSSSSTSTYNSSSSASTVTDEIIKHARFNHRLIGNEKLKPKHCITVHDPSTSRTLILQLSNCSDRTMWAKGLCHLKNLNQKSRNFRWTVVAYLISKYASTLNAHTTSNISTSKGLKGGMVKSFNALKMGLNVGSSSKTKSSHSSNHNQMNTACYFEPIRQIIKAINSGHGNGFDRKYPKKFQKLYKRRQRRLKHHQTNYEQFGENDLMYDPNKMKLKPEDAELYYE